MPVVGTVDVVSGSDSTNIPPKQDKGSSNGGGSHAGGNPDGSGTGIFRPEEVEAQGMPYMCLAQCSEVDTMVGHKKVPPMQERRLQGPAVHGHCYHSRMFIIRYRDEELELGEVVSFQIPVELDAGRRWLEAGQKLVLQMELMFSKLPSLEREVAPPPSQDADGSNGVNKRDVNGRGHGDDESSDEGFELEPVAVQRFEASLSGGHWGIHAYVPVTFSGVHFVRVDCMVHGVLRNLKLEPLKVIRDVDSVGRGGGKSIGEKSLSLSGNRKSNGIGSAAAANNSGDIGLDRPWATSKGYDIVEPVDVVGNDPPAARTASQLLGRDKRKSASKYTWFALYDDQREKIHKRRFSGLDSQNRFDRSRSGSGSTFAGNLSLSRGGSTGGSDPGAAGTAGGGRRESDSSGRFDRDGMNTNSNKQHPSGGWRWGWGRKGSTTAMPRVISGEMRLPESGIVMPALAGGDVCFRTASTSSSVDHDSSSVDEDRKVSVEESRKHRSRGVLDTRSGKTTSSRRRGRGASQELRDMEPDEGDNVGGGQREVCDSSGSSSNSSSSVLGGAVVAGLVAAGVTREEVSSERRRRRKDVYSYFVMPLVRALEAQAGTTTWLKTLLKSEATRLHQSVPMSAEPLWVAPDESAGDDVGRILRRLFASSSDLEGTEPSINGKTVSSALANGDARQSGTPGSGTHGGATRAPASGPDDTGDSAIPAMASVAFPAVIARFCGDAVGSGVDEEESVFSDGLSQLRVNGRASWLDDDAMTCKALEQDIHALAMLVFVDWRAFVTALPGCGGILSRETSALWLAQLRQRWACQTTLHTSAVPHKPVRGIPGPTGGPPADSASSPMRAPRFSCLESEIAADSFGASVRMACADASAPYKLPLQDQHMFPENEGLLPVCLVQRYSSPPQWYQEGNDGSRSISNNSNKSRVVDARSSAVGPPDQTAAGRVGDAQATAPTSPVWVPAFRRSSTLPTSSSTGDMSPRRRGKEQEDQVERPPFLPAKPAASDDPSSSRRSGPGAVRPVNPLEAFTAAFSPVPLPTTESKTAKGSASEDSCARQPPVASNIGVSLTREGRSRLIVNGGRARESLPKSVPEAEAVSRQQHRSRSVSPMARACAGARQAAQVLTRNASKKSTLPESSSPTHEGDPVTPPSTPPNAERSRAKNSRSLSPFFGTKTLAFLSPISQRRARTQWGAPSAPSPTAQGSWSGAAESTWEKTTRRKRDVIKRSASSVISRGKNGNRDHEKEILKLAREFKREKGVGSGPQLMESPIAVRDSNRPPATSTGGAEPGNGADQDPGQLLPRQLSSSPPPRMLPLASAFPSSDAAKAKKSDASPPSSSSSIPSSPRRRASSPLPAAGESRRSSSTSPRRPPPKPMMEQPPTNDQDRNGSELSAAVVDTAISEAVSASRGPSGERPELSSGTGPASFDVSSTKLKFGRTLARKSLLDGVEQSSDLGAFFRQGECQAKIRRGRKSPRPGRNGGRAGEGGADGKVGRRGNVSGFFADGALARGGSVSRRCPTEEGQESINSGRTEDESDGDEEEEETERGHGSGKGVHVIVLHHGYCGSSMDMRLIKNYIRILAPDALVLNAESNERDQHTSMRSMGEKLAKEVHRWTKSQLLEEIGLTDASHPRDSLLCWLSRQPGLEYFRHVVLVSADKDGYVPPQSARIQLCDGSIKDARRGVPHGQIVCEMAQSILAPICDENLYRLHLWGGGRQATGGGGGVDDYIGRAAHISMMDSPSLVCLLLCTLLDLIR